MSSLIRCMARLLLLASALTSVLPAFAQNQSSLISPPPVSLKGTDNRPQLPMVPMPLVAPLFVEDGDFSSTLVLVNGGSVQTYADVTIRRLDGTVAAKKRVQFEPHSQRQVDIRRLLDSGGASSVTVGSIKVIQSHELSGMVISAALSMTRRSTSPFNYIDEELAMPGAEGSQILRAVSDEGQGSPLVAITSISENSQHIQVQCLRTKGIRLSKSVELQKDETLLIDPCTQDTAHISDLQRYVSSLTEDPNEPIGIAIATDGAPGSFAAFSIAPHDKSESRYFSAVPFTDPKMVTSTSTVFAGVPVSSSAPLPDGNYVPSLALANFSKNTAHAVIRYAHTPSQCVIRHARSK